MGGPIDIIPIGWSLLKSLDFMIIGAQKAGTTALSQFLSQHPAVSMAEGKEVHLFSKAGVAELWDAAQINNSYADFFPNPDTNTLFGEATPIYLYWPPIIPALKRYNPDLKVIVLLRDPVARAISQYQMEKVRKNEWLPLWLALLLEPLRLVLAGTELNHAHRCHSYISRGLYAQQLQRLRKDFADNKILILENNELRQQHANTLRRVCEFLAIEVCDIAPALVFEGGYTKQPRGLMDTCVERFLRWRFGASNRKLKKILTEMGVGCNWHWLTAE